MRNEKKHPRKQLEKYSNIFMQLSLVLVLFVVYQVIEFESVKKNTAINMLDFTDEYLYILENEPVKFKKELKKTPKRIKPKATIIDIVEIKKNEDLFKKETIIDTESIDKINETIINALNDYIPEEPKIINDVDFIIIEDAPVFKGCEGLSKEENKKCFISSIQKFVINKFDVDLAQELGLRPGKYKIFAQFVISKSGNVSDIKIKAPHPKLEKETKKIITKLPQFTPGMQRKVPVNVKFTLPITFSVQ
jgi:protein TonB